MRGGGRLPGSCCWGCSSASSWDSTSWPRPYGTDEARLVDGWSQCAVLAGGNRADGSGDESGRALWYGWSARRRHLNVGADGARVPAEPDAADLSHGWRVRGQDGVFWRLRGDHDSRCGGSPGAVHGKLYGLLHRVVCN